MISRKTIRAAKTRKALKNHKHAIISTIGGLGIAAASFTAGAWANSPDNFLLTSTHHSFSASGPSSNGMGGDMKDKMAAKAKMKKECEEMKKAMKEDMAQMKKDMADMKAEMKANMKKDMADMEKDKADIKANMKKEAAAMDSTQMGIKAVTNSSMKMDNPSPSPSHDMNNMSEEDMKNMKNHNMKDHD